MSTRIIDEYPYDMRGIICDFLMGEKEALKYSHDVMLQDLRVLITQLDTKKYSSFMNQFIERDKDPKISWEEKLKYRQQCTDYMYDHCLKPAPLSVIFKRIHEWTDSYREFHCNL